ncbi:MAG TPA: NAD(P)-dependent oxidoreductase [Gemmatimonadales bacterium]|nr:NAD(P)-dependent oxidoreductase [Gemmatimonadales bacterium]
MRVLVTGATGFVGSHLVEALRRRGDDVAALVRSPGKAAALAALGVQQVRGTLDDSAALAHGVQDRDVVFHLAGLTAARDEAEFVRCNRDGTARLLEAAERAGVRRFVLVSSLAAAGPAQPGRPLRGDEPPRPVTAYGRSKLAGEEVVRASRVPWTIVRPPMVYGPRDREVLRVFRLARIGFAPVFGDGTQELSAVHGADLAAALLAAAAAPVACRRIYHACHPEVFTSLEFIRAVGRTLGRRVTAVRIPPAVGRLALAGTGAAARAAGRATILTRDKANEFFQPAWTGDPSALAGDTGWRADHDLTAGLADTWRWYQEAGWL